MTTIDKRIVRLGIETNGEVKFYEGLSIHAKGVKFTSPNQGQCTVTVLNLNRDTREYLMQEANPVNASSERKGIVLEVGRESYGTSILYTGDIFRVYPTEKPDLGLEIKCITGNANKAKLISKASNQNEKLSIIAQSVASDNGLTLSFEIPDKTISNYSFSGSANAEIKRLEELAQADVYAENGILYVKETGQPKTGATVRILNKNTGMVGVPKGTENGITVTALYDPVSNIGSRLELTSEINPVLDGMYCIYKLEFDISSRDVPFYLNMEANRLL